MANPPPPAEEPRILIAEPATDDSQNVDYWQSVDADPLMVVLVERIESGEKLSPKLIEAARAGEVMSNTYVFSTLALALDFAEAETEGGPCSCLILAKRIDDPGYGDRESGSLCREVLDDEPDE